MSKKHFIALAKILHECRSDDPQFSSLVAMLCGYFATQNVNFDQGKFVDAVFNGK